MRAAICILTTNRQEYASSHFLTVLNVAVFSYLQTDGIKGYFTVFNLRFPDEMCNSLFFHTFIGCLDLLFCQEPLSSWTILLFVLLLKHESVLYILDMNLLSV